MSLTRTADIYMDVLYRAAAREKVGPAVQKSMAGLFKNWTALPKAQAALLSPRIPFDQKMRILEILTPPMPKKAGDLLPRFLALLWRHGRGRLLPLIAKGYDDYVAHQEHLELGEVVSATPLSPEVITHLSRVLEAGLGLSVRLKAKVDPSVLGGFRVRAGGIILDRTILRQLESLGARFKGATG